MTKGNIITTPKIDPAFEALIPPLSPEERAGLEVSIRAEGCRDALVVWNGGTLLDGHNRLEICQRHGLPFKTVKVDLPDRDAALVWIIRNQFGRRNLSAFSRVELALKLEPLLAKEAAKRMKNGKADPTHKCAEGETRVTLAKMAGVSRRLIDEGKLVAQHADDQTKQKLRENQVSVHAVAKTLKETREREARAAKRNQAAQGVKLHSQIHVGDFRKLADKVPDGSLSLIFTDPPYDRRMTELCRELGRFASAKLADGGSLLCYMGHVHLLEAANALSESLRYWWTCACVHQGSAGTTLMREYGVRVTWKPVLWFIKGSRGHAGIMFDSMSSGTEKDHHDWQQGEGEAAYCIEHLCPADGIVCDPFLGSGTTAAAAQKLGRRWIGFEIDPKTAKIASGRLKQCLPSHSTSRKPSSAAEVFEYAESVGIPKAVAIRFINNNARQGWRLRKSWQSALHCNSKLTPHPSASSFPAS